MIGTTLEQPRDSADDGHDFSYVEEPDIPAGMTMADYRRSREEGSK
jgi:hypothetical protein